MLLFITILSIIGSLFLGLFVFKNNPKSDTNKLFFFLTLTVVFWAAANYVSLNPPEYTNHLLWIRLVMFFAVPNASSFLLLMHTYPSDKIRFKTTFYYLYAFISCMVMLLSLSPYVFSELNYINGSAQPKPGFLMPLFGIYVVISIGSGMIMLIQKYRHATGIHKLQLSYVIFGTVSMFSLILLTILFPVVFFGNSYFVQFSPEYTIPFIGALAYSIIKHRLLNVRMVLARTISYTFLLIFSSVLYGLLFVIFTFIVIPIKSNSTLVTAISTFTLGLIMSLSFQPIRIFLEKATDKVLYKNKYDSAKLLYNLTHIMASTLSLENLMHLLLQEVTHEMRINHGAFVLLKDSKIIQVAHEGYTKTPEFDEDNICILVNSHGLCIRDEASDLEITKALEQTDSALVVVLQTEDKQIGLLLLGDKLSGDLYSNDDIKLLEILAPEAAVAIENAKSYEEIRRFNITLKEEIDKATKDLQNANSRLKDLDKLKDEFVSLASHELRTPMTAIKSYLWLFLEKNKDKIETADKQYLERAYQSTDRLIALVNDMLNVSRIESGRVTLHIAPLSLEQMADEVISELSAAAQKQQITLSVTKASEPLPVINADKDKTREVFINLVGNSLKFTPPGGKITISLKRDNEHIVTSVQDTGSGIKKEDLPKLFHKFQTVGSNYLTKINLQGTGLGLYLSKSIIELQGGKIWAESEGENKGTTFHFSLRINNETPVITEEKTTPVAATA